MLTDVLIWLAAGIAAVWKLSQLARAPRDTALQVITLGVLLVFVALSAQVALGIPAVYTMLPDRPGKLIQNVVLVFSFALLVVLFRSAAQPELSNRARYFEFLPAMLGGAGLMLAYLATATGLRGVNYEDAGASAGMLAFYLIGNLYFSYGTARCAYLAATVAKQTNFRVRLSLRAAAGGLLICCFGTHLPRVLSTAGRLLFDVDPLPGTETWTAPMLATGSIVFFTGVLYPGARTGIVKLLLWFEVRRQHREIRPLWILLCRQFPHIVLFPPRSALREALQVRHLRLHYYRRVVECRDGLVCLSSYLERPADADGSTEAQAELVRAALCRRERGDAPAPASVLAAPAAPGMAADTRELLMLSRALSSG